MSGPVLATSGGGLHGQLAEAPLAVDQHSRAVTRHLGEGLHLERHPVGVDDGVALLVAGREAAPRRRPPARRRRRGARRTVGGPRRRARCGAPRRPPPPTPPPPRRRLRCRARTGPGTRAPGWLREWWPARGRRRSRSRGGRARRAGPRPRLAAPPATSATPGRASSPMSSAPSFVAAPSSLSLPQAVTATAATSSAATRAARRAEARPTCDGGGATGAASERGRAAGTFTPGGCGRRGRRARVRAPSSRRRLSPPTNPMPSALLPRHGGRSQGSSLRVVPNRGLGRRTRTIRNRARTGRCPVANGFRHAAGGAAVLGGVPARNLPSGCETRQGEPSSAA